MKKQIKLIDIEWEIDEWAIEGVRCHTGEKYGHLLCDAEEEEENLPRELTIEVSELADMDDLHDLITQIVHPLYCVCASYRIDEDEESFLC